MPSFRRARSLPSRSRDGNKTGLDARETPAMRSMFDSTTVNKNGQQQVYHNGSRRPVSPLEYKDPFFDPPPSLGVRSSDATQTIQNGQGAPPEEDEVLERNIESDALLNVEISSSVESSNFYIPVSLMVEREQTMRQTAKEYGIGPDRWSESLLFREWRNAEDDDISSTPEDRVEFVQQNGDMTIRLDPEKDCAKSNHSHSLKWRPWLTTCIRAFYNTGTIRIPDECIGSDILLALEYFGIVYTPDQLVFDSFGAYLRVKVWSEYYTHRSRLAEWVVHRLLSSHSRHSHTFVTSPSPEEGDVAVGSKRAEVLDGNLRLDPAKYTKTPSCAVVHDFFHDEDQPKGVAMPLDSLMREDFAHYVENSLPGTRVSFALKEVHLMKTGKLVNRATMHIDFVSEHKEVTPRLPIDKKMESSAFQKKKNQDNHSSSSERETILGRLGSGMLRSRSGEERDGSTPKFSTLKPAPSADHVYDELRRENRRVKKVKGRSALTVDHVYNDIEQTFAKNTPSHGTTTSNMLRSYEADVTARKVKNADPNSQPERDTPTDSVLTDELYYSAAATPSTPPTKKTAKKAPLTPQTVLTDERGVSNPSTPSTLPSVTLPSSILPANDLARSTPITPATSNAPFDEGPNHSRPKNETWKMHKQGNSRESPAIYPDGTLPDSEKQQIPSVAPSDEKRLQYLHPPVPVDSIGDDNVTVISGITSPWRDEESGIDGIPSASSWKKEEIISSKQDQQEKMQRPGSAAAMKERSVSSLQHGSVADRYEYTASEAGIITTTTNTGATDSVDPVDPFSSQSQCGGTDLLSATMCYVFGSPQHSRIAKHDHNRRSLSNGGGSKVSADELSTAGRGRSAMSAIEAFLPDIDLASQASEDIDLGSLPSSRRTPTIENTAAEWLRKAITFNHFIHDDPVAETDEYLNLARRAGSRHAYRDTKQGEKKEKSAGTRVKDILDGLMLDGLVGNNNSLLDSMTTKSASTFSTLTSAQTVTSESTTTLKKDIFVPIESTTSSSYFIPKRLPKGHATPIVEERTPSDCEGRQAFSRERRRFPTPRRISDRTPPRPRVPQDSNRSMSPLARIRSPLRMRAKRGNVSAVDSEETPVVQNVKVTPMYGDDVEKPKHKGIAGLLRSKGLVRRRSLDASIARVEQGFELEQGKLYTF